MGARDVGQVFSTRRSVAASRLRPPLLPRGFVSRSSVLASVRDARFIAVVAPGGYGKTCALVELAGLVKRPAWYTVRAEDSDPGLLAYGLAVALAGADAEV